MSVTTYRVALSAIVLAMAAAYLLLCVNVHFWKSDVQVMLVHWGVFVDAAQNLTLGLMPIHDVPMQYGLGSASVLSLFCLFANDCWAGLYNLLFVITPIYCLLMYYAYRGAFPNPPFALRIVFALLAYLSIFLWTSYWPLHNLAIPSVGAIRFLPVLSLLVLLQHGKIKSAYALFGLAIWWSPEAAIMSGTILTAHECVRLNLNKCVVHVGGIALVSVLLGSVCFLMVWGQLPDPRVYVEYILHLPGRLDPDFY